ncbi:hypothetical protein POTOM_024288 [Populus tomentosa]|uniref:Uncharacterized protein n=1 Tax=Populus tomentosa TaxID=118781 RepID=A0A8X7ZRP4_POPTO|nr:hypothetical protein POTOM_024288 [Populus tomentosa]
MGDQLNTSAQNPKNFTSGQPITAKKPMYRSHHSSTLGLLHKVLLRFNFPSSNEVLCVFRKMFTCLIFSLSLMQFSEDSLVRSTFIFPWYRDTHQGNLICGRFLGDLAGTDELLSSAFFFFAPFYR